MSSWPSSTADLAALADEFARMSAARTGSVALAADRISTALTALLDALARVRRAATPAAVLDCAPRELCGAGIYDRVMVSRVRGSMWSPEVLYLAGSDGRITRSVDASPDGRIEDLRIPLASPLVEAEVVRRRLPALVQDAQDEPRTYRPLIERMRTREYVVAPVIAASSVIGLLHADRVADTRPLSTVDRDLLRMFADSVGLAFERAGLAERNEQQRQQIAEVCQTAVDSLSELGAIPVMQNRAAFAANVIHRESLPLPREHNDEPRESARLSRLTAREREVLALLASGATNAQLADQLTVAESTVKSHVKHILHKLGAGNRAAAISCYLRETRTDERRLR